MKIYFYKSDNGREPVKEALNKLPLIERANAYEKLEGVELYGFNFSRVVFKQIKGKLWEIKYKFKNQHRILYCLKEAEIMVLLHYVKKKTQKLEINDREIAEQRMMEVFKNEK